VDDVVKPYLKRNACQSAVAAFLAFSAGLAMSPERVAALSGVKAEPKPLVVADLVPVPRPNPVRRSADPIGDVSNDASDSSLATPDEAEASSQTASAAAPPPPPIGPQRSALAEAAFKIAIRLYDQGDANAALLASYALPDPIDSKIIKWLVAVYKFRDVPAARIDDVSKELADWPGQKLLRIRFEQALELQKASPGEIIEAFAGTPPVSDDGTLLLAHAFVMTGNKAQAAALIRTRWREDTLDDDFEETLREEFGDLLTMTDHKTRMDRMLYQERTEKALRVAAELGDDQQALAKAVVAVIKQDKDAGSALDSLPKSVQDDPIAIYSRIQFLRRADEIEPAAKLMLSASRDPDVLIEPDAWWVERRVLAREVMSQKDYRTAYRIVAGHSAQSPESRAEAEFHAGWISLEFLKDPAAAKPHFSVIQTISTRPLSQSRAEYWLGRAALAAGDSEEAERQFRLAAAYPTTFYGQLALSRLGAKTLPLAPQPTPDIAARKAFANLELVQVIYRLGEIKKDDRKDLFVRHLAETLTDPTELALLLEMAEEDRGQTYALQLAKTAGYRGVPVDTLAFPTNAIPSSANVGKVDLAVVYAIARQESAFHTGAVSGAGARGLLQLMPGTAKQMAKRAGVSYSKSKLTEDPAYNANLGSHFLDHLLGRYDGSYIMTFAAYNAGPSRVADWVKRYGDPRDPDVDAVNWIEQIPFTETRNYVQRTIENLTVYRARLGSPALTIDADIKRGARS
jgi:peptidoglycan lytic transglycosylase